MKVYLLKRSVFALVITFPLLINAQTLTDKPYSLEKDFDNRKQVWDENSIKSPSDSLINHVLYVLRNGDEEDILFCFQHYINKLDNKTILKTLDSLLLATDNETIMIEIINTLRFHVYTEAIPSMLIRLNHENVYVRYKLACALAALGEKEKSIRTFEDVWDDVNWQNKQGINRGLRNIGNSESISLLINNTRDTNTYVACGAAICLAQIGIYDEAFPILKEMLLIDERKVSAMNGLAYIGDERSLELISVMVNDKNAHVRSQSQRILKSYGFIGKEVEDESDK